MRPADSDSSALSSELEMPRGRVQSWDTGSNDDLREADGQEVPVLAGACWHDARFQNGTPVEIKSTMREHSEGQPGNFEVYKQYHEKLRRADGWYCFVVYRPHGRSGCTVLDDRMVRAGDLPLLRWHGGGDHRGTEQAKISISDIF